MGFVLLDPVVKHYPWGSRTALRRLRGLGGEAAEPEAELWVGAHPQGPARLQGRTRTLGEHVEEDAHRVLGSRVLDGFGVRVPFLLKLLAVERALSIQAHPNADQARAGFLREEATGIPRTAPERCYRDDQPKPELLVALSPFEALCGFRPLAEALPVLRAVVEAAPAPGLADPLAAATVATDEPVARRRLLEALWALDDARRESLLKGGRVVGEQLLARGGWDGARGRCLLRLLQEHPGDVGAVITLLLHHLQLSPGDALFVRAGQLHAYLSGLAVEVMTSSDNVLRGGLTRKHVDQAELVSVLDFAAAQPSLVPGRTSPTGETAYPVPISCFQLSRVTVTGGVPPRRVPAGLELHMCTRGVVRLASDAGSTVELTAGMAALCEADTGPYVVSGAGDLYRARAGVMA